MGSDCTCCFGTRFLSCIIILFMKTTSHHFYYRRCRIVNDLISVPKELRGQRRFGATGGGGCRPRGPKDRPSQGLVGGSVRRGHLRPLPSQSGPASFRWQCRGEASSVSRPAQEAVGRALAALGPSAEWGCGENCVREAFLCPHSAPFPPPIYLPLTPPHTRRPRPGTVDSSSFVPPGQQGSPTPRHSPTVEAKAPCKPQTDRHRLRQRDRWSVTEGGRGRWKVQEWEVGPAVTMPGCWHSAGNGPVGLCWLRGPGGAGESGHWVEDMGPTTRAAPETKQR